MGSPKARTMGFSSEIKQAPSSRRVKLRFGDIGKAGGQPSQSEPASR